MRESPPAAPDARCRSRQVVAAQARRLRCKTVYSTASTQARTSAGSVLEADSLLWQKDPLRCARLMRKSLIAEKQPAKEALSWRGRSGELQRLNARSASNKSSSIFFNKPCGKSGDSACGAACLAGRHLRSHPNDDGVSVARRDRNRAQLPARRHQSIRLLSALAAIGAAPGRDRAARRHSTPGSQAPLLRLPTDWRSAPARRLARQSQAGAALDARGQPFVPAPDPVCANDDELTSHLVRGSQSDPRYRAQRPRSTLGGRYHLILDAFSRSRLVSVVVLRWPSSAETSPPRLSLMLFRSRQASDKPEAYMPDVARAVSGIPRANPGGRVTPRF